MRQEIIRYPLTLRRLGFPSRDGILAICDVGQMRGGCGADACLHRSARGLAAANAFQPIAEVEHFPVRLIIKVCALGACAQHPLHFRFGGKLCIAIAGVALAFGDYFQAAAVQIQGGFRAHELQHCAVARVHEGRLEIDLRLGVLQEGLGGVRRLPLPGHEMIPDGHGFFRVIHIQIPVGDIDVMNHEVRHHAAAKIARQALGGKDGFVLGDIGPVGGMLEPYGDLEVDDVRAALAQQALALVEGGVDAIILETQTSLDELGLGIQGAKAAGALFIIASLAYDRSMDGTFFKTMMGVSPEQAAQFAQKEGADAIALNCGTGMDMAAAAKIARLYRASCDLFTMVQPNAGLPVLENMKAVYKQTPEQMAAAVPEALAAGANIIGSCCGSAPEHTRAIRAVVDRFNASQKA